MLFSVVLPVYGLYRSPEVDALLGLQHPDSGDEVGWSPFGAGSGESGEFDPR